MPLTEPQEALRAIARERIAKGQLPCERSSRIFGGLGSGQLCSLCDKPIARYQVEYEIELKEATFRFHTICHYMWELECANVESSRKNP